MLDLVSSTDSIVYHLRSYDSVPFIAVTTLALSIILCALTLIDIAQMRLPDPLTAAVFLLGIIVTLILNTDDLAEHLLATAGGYLILHLVSVLYLHFRGYAGLGMGDAKLFGAAGAWVGFRGLPLVLLGAGVAGLA
jgi:leader peptidase (prepilin peptidase)/N-methyltransferase